MFKRLGGKAMFEMFDVIHMICTFMGRFFRYFLRCPGVFACRFLSFKGVCTMYFLHSGHS
jgi:hypothetical protein